MSLDARIKHKRDTAANWEKNNPVLLEGEIAIVITENGDQFKVGDGSSNYKSLKFVGEELHDQMLEAISGKAAENHKHSYNDLNDKPTIPTVGNGTIIIKQAGAEKGRFSMNQSGDATIELTDNNDNTVYTHPTSSGNKHIPSGGSSGQILRWKSNGTAEWGADNNTEYSAATQSSAGLMSADDKKKLDGIATGANKTTVDSALSTSSTNPVQNKVINSALSGKLSTSLKGAANGLAELDSNGKVPSSQLPSYVDDVIEGYYYNSKFYKESAHTTEITGESGKIYTDLSGSNKTYRWGGSTAGFVEISPSIALGETSSTAYRGDRGKVAYDHAVSSHNYSASGHTHTVTHKPAGSNSETSITPAGSVSSSFTGTEAKHKHNFSGTQATISSSFTPAGNVSSSFTGSKHTHTFTGTAGTTDKPDTTNVTSIYSITSVGTLPSATLSPGSHSFSEGTLPTLTSKIENKLMTVTFSQGTLPSASWTAPSLDFKAGTLPKRSSAISMPNANHTHSFTPAGTNAEVTAGGSISSSFTGTAGTASATYTPAGTISETSITPAGSVSSSFTGTAAKHTHTFTGTSATLTTSSES